MPDGLGDFDFLQGSQNINLLKRLQIEDLVFGDIVLTELNNQGTSTKQLRNNKCIQSVNAPVRVHKKAPSSVDGKKRKTPQRQQHCASPTRKNGVSATGAKNSNFKDDKARKSTQRTKKNQTVPSSLASTSEAAAAPSPLQRPATPLTPSLDPELLRQFEEEDRPKRVLRSSTIAVGCKNNPNIFSNRRSSIPERKKAAILRRPYARTSKKQKLNNLTSCALLVNNVSAVKSFGPQKKRYKSEGDTMNDNKPEKAKQRRVCFLFIVEVPLHSRVFVFF
ncbi:unnamed protein product [Gongylonema pulchrum]|uniref:Uncharacterized protein n=1 Tax=Gongylonema pulchrum TaxID=637853 RepID=A0A183CXW5_9BILA|nr:unnamed protein product [Gongylonema pulchrum]